MFPLSIFVYSQYLPPFLFWYTFILILITLPHYNTPQYPYFILF
ncbi:hypothetical protein KSS87_021538 [Heliosperma pusillum]|nr:hypothetical protein KSS87_021538 [Heliosperma pusillum]